MQPFLCKDLERLHRTLLLWIVKPTILDKCDSPSTLLKLRFCDQDIYLKAKDRHFGFSVEEELEILLHQDQAAAVDIKNFQNKASSMVVSLLKKLTEKIPMHFCVVKNASVFDPALLVSLDSTGLRCSMKNLLTHWVSLKIISATLAEKALLQYLDLLAAINQKDLEKASLLITKTQGWMLSTLMRCHLRCLLVDINIETSVNLESWTIKCRERVQCK